MKNDNLKGQHRINEQIRAKKSASWAMILNQQYIRLHKP